MSTFEESKFLTHNSIPCLIWIYKQVYSLVFQACMAHTHYYPNQSIREAQPLGIPYFHLTSLLQGLGNDSQGLPYSPQCQKYNLCLFKHHHHSI